MVGGGSLGNESLARHFQKRKPIEQWSVSKTAEALVTVFANGSHLAPVATVARAFAEEVPNCPGPVKDFASLGAWGDQSCHEERDFNRWTKHLFDSGLEKYSLSTYLQLLCFLPPPL